MENNANGLRTQKKHFAADGSVITTDYILHGKLITHLTKREVDPNKQDPTIDELHFFYDAQSRPAFVEYNNIKYRYIHNLQGDIVAIVDPIGTPVVEYKYDAWGTLSYEDGCMLYTLGILNPFRYRGYTWDGEIELYYLKNRYYNSIIQRFLSPDAVVLPDKDLSNCNIYAYCQNNPCCGVDKNGDSWFNVCLDWVSENIIDPVVEGVTAFVSGIDMTFSVGFSVSASLGFWSYSASLCVSMDLEGNMGIQGSYTAGLTTGDIGASASTFIAVTNAPTIYALEGESTQIGIDVTGGFVECGADAVIFDSGNKTYNGYSISLGLKTPKPLTLVHVDAHTSIVYTSPTYICGNPFANFKSKSATKNSF